MGRCLEPPLALQSKVTSADVQSKVESADLQSKVTSGDLQSKVESADLQSPHKSSRLSRIDPLVQKALKRLFAHRSECRVRGHGRREAGVAHDVANELQGGPRAEGWHLSKSVS